jgi:hypothetical protein
MAAGTLLAGRLSGHPSAGAWLLYLAVFALVFVPIWILMRAGTISVPGRRRGDRAPG